MREIIKYIAFCVIVFSLIQCNASENTDGEEIPHPQTGETYIPAKAVRFIDALGVNTHLGYDFTNYKYYDEYVKKNLLDIGIKHIRDNTYTPEVVEKYKDLGQSGIRLLLISDAESAVEKAASLQPMIWGIEGENELDLNKDNTDWITVAQQQTKDLFNNIKSDERTANLPVVGISLAHIKTSADLVGDLSEWMDYGNAHPYAAGQHPAVHWGNGMAMNEVIEKAKVVCGDKSIVTTEAGYHNKIDNPNHPGVSERAAALYQVQLPFVYFNEGIHRIYKYEFLDLNPDPEMQDMECHFGLIRADGTPKESFYAIKNLIKILNDKSEDFDVNPISFSIKVPQSISLMKSVLQKSDGSYWIALFRKESVFDLQAKTDVSLSAIPVKVIFDKTCSSVKKYVPNDSEKGEDIKFNRNEVVVSVGGKLVLLNISF